MKHISILVPEGNCSLVNIEGTHQIFHQVNAVLASAGQPPLFRVQLVGLRNEMAQHSGLFRIRPDVLIGEVAQTDLIVIPAVHGEKTEMINANSAFLPWLVQQHRGGAAIASLCIGVFLLAATGLLKGKRCATHWVEADNFRRLFPDVHLLPEKIITDEDGLYTSGGAYSWLNLIIYLVEKFAGREMAITCSKLFEVGVERSSQSAFMIFSPQKRHGDEAVKKVQDYIEAHFTQKISVDHLAKAVSLSRRNLERRFRKATYNSIVEYVQRVRIEAAKQMLEQERENVAEAMYGAGYNDGKAFRTTFKKLTGLSPLAYRNKYVRCTLSW